MAQMTEDLQKCADTFGDPTVAALYAIAAQLSRLNDNLEDVTTDEGHLADKIRVQMIP